MLFVITASRVNTGTQKKTVFFVKFCKLTRLVVKIMVENLIVKFRQQQLINADHLLWPGCNRKPFFTISCTRNNSFL